jgi:hypothetical protein
MTVVKKCTGVAAAMVVFCVSACAQEGALRPLSDRDSRAAYCFGVVFHQIDSFTKMVKKADSWAAAGRLTDAQADARIRAKGTLVVMTELRDKMGEYLKANGGPMRGSTEQIEVVTERGIRDSVKCVAADDSSPSCEQVAHCLDDWPPF